MHTLRLCEHFLSRARQCLKCGVKSLDQTICLREIDRWLTVLDAQLGEEASKLSQDEGSAIVRNLLPWADQIVKKLAAGRRWSPSKCHFSRWMWMGTWRDSQLRGEYNGTIKQRRRSCQIYWNFLKGLKMFQLEPLVLVVCTVDGSYTLHSVSQKNSISSNMPAHQVWEWTVFLHFLDACMAGMTSLENLWLKRRRYYNPCPTQMWVLLALINSLCQCLL